jgi:hypothetical protein
MQAIIYLLKRQYINKIKRVFSSVISAIITIIAVLCFGATFVIAFINKDAMMITKSAETLLAGVLLMFGAILYNSFLSRDSGILTMADANFLFTGPFEKRTVLAYILISTAPASLLTGLFMCFFLPYLLGPALTVPKFLIVLLIISLLFGCIYLSYYYIYIVDADKPGFKKIARKTFLAVLGILALIFVALFFHTGFNIRAASQEFFTGSWYNWVPLFGWSKWAINSLMTGNILAGFIPAAALLVISNAALCYALYNSKSDFYEKTMEDSVNLQKVLEDVKANGSADVRSVAKLKKNASAVRFRQGAAAIFSRQLLESNKLSFMQNFSDAFLSLFYIVIGVLFDLQFTFVLAMVGFGAISMSLRDSWHRDFKKPYVFLIPDSSFRKVIYSVLPGIIKTLVSGCISITVGAIIYKINPLDIIAYLILFAGFVFLFIFAEVLTYRIIGSNSNAMTVTFMRMSFAIAACIPSIVILTIAAIILEGSLNIMAISVCMFGVNVAISGLLAYLSRGIFEKSEIMD